MVTRSTKSDKKNSAIKTFTYFIPAPPNRKTGYREKEFDKIMQGIFNSGFELVSLHTQGINGDSHGGLFILAVLKAKSKKIADLDKDLDIHDRFKLAHSHSHPDIVLDDDEI